MTLIWYHAQYNNLVQPLLPSSDHPGRHSCNQASMFDVFGHYGSCSHRDSIANGDTWADGGRSQMQMTNLSAEKPCFRASARVERYKASPDDAGFRFHLRR